jgi:hypothetical protein
MSIRLILYVSCLEQLNGLKQSLLFEVGIKCYKTHLIWVDIQKGLTVYLKRIFGSIYLLKNGLQYI